MSLIKLNIQLINEISSIHTFFYTDAIRLSLHNNWLLFC